MASRSDGTEVDDHGIDFVARHEEGPFPEAQEKSTRSVGYVFIIVQKEKFKLRPVPCCLMKADLVL
jgi:hypothetical protein